MGMPQAGGIIARNIILKTILKIVDVVPERLQNQKRSALRKKERHAMNALLLALLVTLPAQAETQLERGTNALRKMAGCFLVDYSYTETEGLKPGYERDKRVYDVNQDKSIREWIYVDELSPRKFRVQHVMFAADTDGTPIYGSELKHTGEDWEFEAPYQYDYLSTAKWGVSKLPAGSGKWTRRVTNLDDGLRYQCSAAWEMEKAIPEWSCSGYSPIPGRESRDMGRKDYQGLERATRLMMYGQSFLERQANTKIIHGADGVKIPLAKELGKNWYVRLPDGECAHAVEFMQPRKGFWDLMRDAWAETLDGEGGFREKIVPGKSRYGAFLGLEEKYMSRNLGEPALREQVKAEMKGVIEAFRER